MIREVWAPMYGYEDEYLISTHGRVLSRPRTARNRNGTRTVPGRIIKPGLNSSGYLHFGATRHGVKELVRVHRAVLESFVGPAPEGYVACHWDDVKTNNHLDNLRWATRSNNEHDKVRNGKHNHASKTHCKNGHEFNEENTRLRPGGGRACKTCQAAALRRCRAAKQQRQQRNQEGVA